MTGVLASVTSVEEAKIIINHDVDILDIKNPDKGALGAQPYNVVCDIVNFVDGRIPVSATIGDVSANDPGLPTLIEDMAATGVDFVKVGLFEKDISSEFIVTIKDAADNRIPIVIVLFAENYSVCEKLEPLLSIGLRGIMIDTKLKNDKSLCELLSIDCLQEFVKYTQSHDLITGLAGSLRIKDIPDLLSLNANYLGFRGALCESGQRTNALSSVKIGLVCAEVRNNVTMYHNNDSDYQEAI